VLQADTRAMGQTNSMIDLWKQWEGQVADGRYPLRQLLGATDRGPVFLTESADGQKCAIKLIPADPQNADALMARWEQAAKLAHPHLLRIFHTGRCRLGDARMLYAVMECADEDLSHVAPVRSLSAMEASEMLRPTLEALAFLHGKGLVHGHMKPSNIMAVGEQLKISVDGISAARNPALGRGGKATAYDAPEAGTRGGSAAGDVWSVGVTLVEVLTQRLPAWEFKGQEEPELPRMPAPFGDIAKQCLRRDPQARCTLAEIATRLDPDAPPLGRVPAAVKAVAVAPPVDPVRAAMPAPVPAAIPPKPVVRPEALPEPAPAPVAAAKPPIAEKPRAMAAASSASAAAPKRGFAVPAIAIAAVALVAIVFAPKLLHRNQEMSPDLTASASDQPATAPVPAASAVTAEAKKPEPMAAAAVPSPAMKSVPARKKVAPTAGAVGGGVVHQVLPDVPEKSLETIHGTVRTGVRVTVDASGKVVDAEQESAGPSKYFANLAEKAARGWTFAPPTANGAPAPSEWVVRFEFSPDGAKATATQAAR
jgi:TonB family protein